MAIKFKTISFDGTAVEILDQTRLPIEEIYLRLSNVCEMADAIKRLAVRGAPLIGVAAGYGVVLSALNHKEGDPKIFRKRVSEDIELLSSTRPTAVNLFYALKRMREILNSPADSTQNLKELLIKEATTIHQEDIKMCDRIGNFGESLIDDGCVVMTQCNAGALATSGIGTALAPVYRAKEKGKNASVYVPETRPLLQGARLTAWELSKNNIPVTVICDSARGWVLKGRKVDICIVGADRIVRNGDTANKIGTYTLAVLAKTNGVPFWVAAPRSSFDDSIETGKDIPIEERSAVEISKISKDRIAPDVSFYNPAFDVTEADLITGFITDEGILKK